MMDPEHTLLIVAQQLPALPVAVRVAAHLRQLNRRFLAHAPPPPINILSPTSPWTFVFVADTAIATAGLRWMLADKAEPWTQSIVKNASKHDRTDLLGNISIHFPVCALHTSIWHHALIFSIYREPSNAMKWILKKWPSLYKHALYCAARLASKECLEWITEHYGTSDDAWEGIIAAGFEMNSSDHTSCIRFLLSNGYGKYLTREITGAMVALIDQQLFQLILNELHRQYITL